MDEPFEAIRRERVRDFHCTFDRLDDHRVRVVEVVTLAGDAELEDLGADGVAVAVERGGQGEIATLDRGLGSSPAPWALGWGVVDGHGRSMVLAGRSTAAHQVVA